jgi:hypothetical protein
VQNELLDRAASGNGKQSLLYPHRQILGFGLPMPGLDERHIADRQRLLTLIDWKRIGYEPARCCSDAMTGSCANPTPSQRSCQILTRLAAVFTISSENRRDIKLGR